MARIGPVVVAFAIAVCSIGESNGAQYFGKLLGKLSELHHGVSGEVYAVDGRTLYIKDFTYDGQGPGAYFYASTHKAADKNGFRLRDENGNVDVIRRYRKEGITITLPEGKTLNNIKIFYVWCEDFDVNFGDVTIPRNFDYPRPQKIQPLKGVHSISSDNIVIVDAQTLLIPNLSYDGEAPDAKFWVGPGTKPSPQGIRVPDENGKEIPLRRYDRKTVVLTLPGDLTVFDIGHFGIWCEQFTVDFGHVLIPQSVNIPPSLKMLGVSPQKLQQAEIASSTSRPRPLVGGHLQPTTFRPPSVFSPFGRRSFDAGNAQQNTIDVSPQQITYQEPHRLQVYSAQRTQHSPPQSYQQLPSIQQQQYTVGVQQQQYTVPAQQQPFVVPIQQASQAIPYHHQQHQTPQLIQPNQHHLAPYIQHQNYQQQPYVLQAPTTHPVQQQQNIINQHQNGYVPFNLNQRQYQDQQLYDSYVHSKRLRDEEQLRAQLTRQPNRFDLGRSQNSYTVFGQPF